MPTDYMSLFGLGSGVPYGEARRTAATSTGPYDLGSALGSAYQAQSFDLGQSGRLGQLTDLINTMNRNAQKSSLEARIPNAPALEAKSSENIAAEMRGEVPQDVMNLLGQQAAERGVATGSPGSPNANAAYLRALGLTSLGQEQAGQADLTRAYARNPAAPIFDPTTQLITPYQGALISEANASNNLGVNQLLSQANLAQQRLNLAEQRYAYPSGLGYTGTGTNPLTGSSLFAPDATTTASTGGGDGGTTYNYQSPFQGNFYDYNPPSALPPDYGSPDYATTPVSMYG